MKQKKLCDSDSGERIYLEPNHSNNEGNCCLRIIINKNEFTIANRLRNHFIHIDKPKNECAQQPQMNNSRYQRRLEHKIVQNSFDNAPTNFKFAFHRIILFAIFLPFAMCSIVNGQQLRTAGLDSRNTGE